MDTKDRLETGVARPAGAQWAAAVIIPTRARAVER